MAASSSLSLFTRGQAIEFLERCFGASKASNGGLNISVVCPICRAKTGESNKRKLVIRTDDFRSHCWVCNDPQTKNIYRLVYNHSPELAKQFVSLFGGAYQRFKNKAKPRCVVVDLNTLMEREQSGEFLEEDDNGFSETKEQVVDLPLGFTLLAEWWDKPQKPKSVYFAIQYLKSRGANIADAWYFKYGITDEDRDYRNRVIIPSHDSDGDLNFFTSRTWSDMSRGPKYHNPHFDREHVIFNELNIDWSKELTIVEGPFDLLKANQNATCLLGSSLDETYLLFQRIVHCETPVVLALDNDAKRKTYELAKLFYEYDIKTRIAMVPSSYNDVGQMSKDEFKQILTDASLVTSKALLHYKLKNL